MTDAAARRWLTISSPLSPSCFPALLTAKGPLVFSHRVHAYLRALVGARAHRVGPFLASFSRSERHDWHGSDRGMFGGVAASRARVQGQTSTTRVGGWCELHG
jgi:hypothetical protein